MTKEGLFEASDFDAVDMHPDDDDLVVLERIAARANELVQSRPVVGRNDSDYPNGEWRTPDAEPYPEGWTHRARLMAVEKIEEKQ